MQDHAPTWTYQHISDKAASRHLHMLRQAATVLVALATGITSELRGESLALCFGQVGPFASTPVAAFCVYRLVSGNPFFNRVVLRQTIGYVAVRCMDVARLGHWFGEVGAHVRRMAH